MNVTKEIENGLLSLLNQSVDIKNQLYEGDYQKVLISIFDDSLVKDILSKFKFKDIGNVYDFPEDMPQPELIDEFNVSQEFNLLQRIAVSKKYNSIMFYTTDRYAIDCLFLVDTHHLKKFSKKIKVILQDDSRENMYKNVDFTCKKNEFIEVSDLRTDSMKRADATKKKVPKENFVYNDESTLNEVMKDIYTFFKKDTKEVYDKMQIAYKRGIILHGEPGNGKSAMIREIIRNVPDVIKVVINPNIRSLTGVLSSLISALKGKKAIIIIEDFDSFITSANRSAFLNILDGVDIKSGIYIIGTTNYPERIDPAMMNRSGRFDRSYKIENPSEETRREYFKSRKVNDLLSEFTLYKDSKKKESDDAVIELFVKQSEGLPMASLKEIMTTTRYKLATTEGLSIEEALEETFKTISTDRENHAKSHENYVARNREDVRPQRIEV